MVDWGVFHDRRYLLSAYSYHRRTNFYPNGKSYDEQTRRLQQDFNTLDHRVAHWKRKLGKQKKG